MFETASRWFSFICRRVERSTVQSDLHLCWPRLLASDWLSWHLHSENGEVVHALENTLSSSLFICETTVARTIKNYKIKRGIIGVYAVRFVWRSVARTVNWSPRNQEGEKQQF